MIRWPQPSSSGMHLAAAAVTQTFYVVCFLKSMIILRGNHRSDSFDGVDKVVAAFMFCVATFVMMMFS